MSFNLKLSDFAALGEFAEAGLGSTTLALERAQRSFDEGRVPIAGAAVARNEGGALETVTVGNNGRIPAPDSNSKGYPTDHGETSAIRQVADIGAWDWSRVVFTTTLSPCIMCYRTLAYLNTLGLNKIVIAEAKSFPGTKDRLKALPGMTIVELTNPDSVRMMGSFARTYPWDWNADIGAVPPENLAFAADLPDSTVEQQRLLAAVGSGAAVVGPDGKVLASAQDERDAHGQNPTYSASMIAMGEAGSAVNLRECVLVFAAPGTAVGVAEFGHSSLGACELFRPAAVLSNVRFDDELAGALGAAGMKVIVPR